SAARRTDDRDKLPFFDGKVKVINDHFFSVSHTDLSVFYHTHILSLLPCCQKSIFARIFLKHSPHFPADTAALPSVTDPAILFPVKMRWPHLPAPALLSLPDNSSSPSLRP